MSEAKQDSTDIQLLNEWMNLFGTDVLNVAYSYIRNYAEAQDITQDVFLRAYRNMDKFRSESSVRTWLLSITVNRCKDYLRSWHHRNVAPEEDIEPTGVQETPEQRVVDSLEQEALWNEVGKLSVKYREVLTLFYLRDLSGQEIAQVLNISEQSVRTRLHRARKLLRNLLEEEGWNNESQS
ncbi:sigma-70 family RNA polymerase sigma factor [Alicyclobacillus sp. SO9]|uniref:sigma-70 family RNA polymerase sigma factor n=1 Tax=Alicyclobacillus sp. SO9 TaxID=2665646 RepID=UPI001E3A2E34|nr:sigma-70 family RNA polymerase sigma factor [Alicyclobacillus sp. SO9]